MGGEFAVVDVGGGLHVVPTARRGVTGELEPYASPLSALIDRPTEERTGADIITAIARLVTRGGWAEFPPSPDERTAYEAALERAKEQAESRCRRSFTGSLYRFVRSDVGNHKPKPERIKGGFVVGIEGDSVCSVEHLVQTERESCVSPTGQR